MKAPNITVILLVLSAATLTFGNAHAGSRLQYFEPLQSMEVDTRSLRFNAFSRSFNIELQTNNRISRASQANTDNPVAAYQGRLIDNPDSWVRIVVANGQPRGLIWNGSEMYSIETSAGHGGMPVIFRIADLIIEPGTMQCGDIGNAENGAELLMSVVGEISNAAQSGPGATSQIDIGVIGDFEFTSDKGANVNAELVTRLNNVDGIFSEQLAVQLNVGDIETYPNNDDPFTDELDAGQLLDELADHRQGTPAQNANGLTHLFTGRDLDGTTVGVAFGGALCLNRFGAGLTQGTNTAALDSLIAAHEIGHNFGAPHDGTSGSACETTAQDFLMAPSLNGSDTFSACSIVEMQDDVANAPCITPLAVSEVAVFAGSVQPTTLLGNTIGASFDVSSLGASTADNVSIDVSIPNNVTLQSATASVGTCTSGAGNVSCAIGNLAGSSSATVTITATAAAVGDAMFMATVSADVDTNANNNQASLQVQIDPAVELGVTAASQSSLAVNQSTVLTLSLANGATISATNVNLTLEFTGGVRVDSAVWAQGSCTIDVLDVTCLANAIAAQANSTITIGLTGLSVGTHFYAVALSANEPDISPANNIANGSIEVTGGSSNDSGGSGAVGILFIALLGGVGLSRRRRPSKPITF